MSVPPSARGEQPGRGERSMRSIHLAPDADARRASSLSTQYRFTPSAEQRRAASVGQLTRHRWPPSPTVEEEAQSLAREKSPPRAQDSGNGGPSPGAIDQVPIMEDVQSASESSSENVQSAPVSEDPPTPSLPETNQEKRFVLVSKQPAADDRHTQASPTLDPRSLRPEHSPPRSRSRSRLRIDPEAASKSASRTSSYERLRTTDSTGFSQEYVASPVPLSTTSRYPHGSFGPAATKKPNSNLSVPYEPHSQSHSGSGITRGANLPQQWPSTGDVNEAFVSSLDRALNSIPKDSDASSEVSSRSRTRGRDRKPRSRANSRSSSDSGSTDDSSDDGVTQPKRRSAQYSISGRDLPSEGRRLQQPPGKTSSVHAQPMRIPQMPQARFESTRLMPGSASHQPTSSSLPNTSYLSTNGRKHFTSSARVSPRPSPLNSPHNTPPPSPGRERESWLPLMSPPHSRQNSRPVTPSMLSPDYKEGSFHQERSNSNYAPPRNPSHQVSRPVTPSERSDPAQPQMMEVNRGASGISLPRSRQTSPYPMPERNEVSQERRKAQTVPTYLAPQQGAEDTTSEVVRRRQTSRHDEAQQPVLPPAAQGKNREFPPPPASVSSGSEHLRRSFELPPRSLVDPSQAAIRSRSVAPHKLPHLPPCPRPTYVRGYQDWSTLPGHPDFDICPTCRDGLEEAGIEARFIPSLQSSGGPAVRCDMSIPWVRMAWILLLQKRPTSPHLIHQITSAISQEEPCPGRQLAPRTWYRLYDTEHGKYVSNFDVCKRCVRLLEALFPNLRGILQKLDSPDAVRNCDLRSDSRRFRRYLDLLDTISRHAFDYRRPPNMHHFVVLARQMASIRECREDDQLREVRWHFIAHLPDFTVCEECYRDAVWPQIKGGSDLAADFHRSPKYPPQTPIPLSCQLYSPRMREIWKLACERDDYERLRSAVKQRVAKERELQARHAQIQHLPADERVKHGALLVAEWRRWA